jgi:DNA-binding GntR family transcriptional regulator
VIKLGADQGATTLPEIPDYQRIEADLRRRIAAGEWKPGERLPTRQQLAEYYETSLQPVINALTRLQLAGVVVGQQGKGIFVAGG